METKTKNVRRRKVTSALLWVFAIVFFYAYSLMSVVGGAGWSVALCNHDQTAMRRYLSFPVHPDFLGIQGTTPLLWATRAGERDTVRILLTRGANPAKGIYGIAYLRRHNAEAARRMWQEYLPYIRSERTHEPSDLHTFLRCALYQQDWDVAQWLIMQGADVNSGVNYGNDTLLIEFTRNPQNTANVKACAFLLQSGAWVNVRGYQGTTALTSAAEAKNMPLIKLLKQHGATR